ncbi:hypothetical protein [Halorientalis salina]|uniref:hypothetical protein n=1 Tax=Halorientalis salina TaxID=2932266 RepID=UPI0010AC0B2D|nr:hypothetical protein [Halorientalis salina]
MRRSFAFVCCAVLVVLAGCSGGGPTTETAASTASPTATPTAEATDAEPGSDLNLSVGVTVTGDQLARAHAATLRNESYTLVSDFGGGSTVTRVDGTGLARIAPPHRSFVYRAAGVTYRNRSTLVERRYLARPTRANVSTGAGVLGDFSIRFEVVETTTVDDERRAIMRRAAARANASDPRPYYRLVATDSGLVRNYTHGVSRPDHGLAVTESFTVSNVGETTFERPDWLTRLREAPVDGATDTGTVVVERPELDARLQVVGAVRNLRDVGLRENWDDWLAEGIVAEAGVSPVVNPVVRDRSANATVTVGYDESRLPDGASERNVSLFVYNESVGTYVQMHTTVDTGADTATATRAHEVTYSSGGGPEETVRPTIAHPLGRPVVVAMHVPTYYEAWRGG